MVMKSLNQLKQGDMVVERLNGIDTKLQVTKIERRSQHTRVEFRNWTGARVSRTYPHTKIMRKV